MSDTTDYKQIAFSLQEDIKFLRWENAQKDLSFLKEMKQHAEKAFEENDYVSKEMLKNMIDHWIHELEQILSK